MIRFFKHLKVILLCSLLLFVTTPTCISNSSDITVQGDDSPYPSVDVYSFNQFL